MNLKSVMELWRRAELYLTCAMLCALFSLVMAQIVLRGLSHPIKWAEEGGPYLFLWMIFLGASAAYKHFQHIRIGLVDTFGQRHRQYAILGANAVVAAVCAVILYHAPDVIRLEASSQTTSLPIGLPRALFYSVPLTYMAFSILVSAVVFFMDGGRAPGAGRGDSGMSVLAVALIALILGAVGAPIAFALFSGGIFYFLTGDGLPFAIYLQRVTAQLDSFSLLAIPLFILAGNLMNHTGIAERIFDAALAVFGRVRGSLAYVNVASSMVFAGMSGVAQADAAGLGAIEIKAMRRHGYDPAFAAALTASSSIIGPLIPPSVIMIVYAVTAQVSVGDLFLAGIVPGVAAGLAMMGLIAFLARRNPERFPVAGALSSAQRRRAFVRAVPALLAPLILIVGLLWGVVTPTELSAVAVAYSVLYGFAVRELDGAKLALALQQTVLTCGVVMLIVAAAIPIGWIIAINNVPFLMSDWILGITQQRWLVLLMLNVIFLIAGCFIETTAILLIGLPALLPLAAQIGVDPIHLGLIVIFNLLLGGLTPPFGVLLFIVMHIANLGLGAIVRALVPFYLLLFAMLLLITYWPDPWLFLPRHF